MHTSELLMSVILPVVILSFAAYFIVHKVLASIHEKRIHEGQLAKEKITLPVRLQAYERIVLLLERINPSNLVMRVNNPNLNSSQLQTAMVQAIREEFSHNLSQQVYVSARCWNQVRIAVEETIRLINSVASKVDRGSPSFELATQLLEAALELQSDTVATALEFTRSEAHSLISK